MADLKQKLADLESQHQAAIQDVQRAQANLFRLEGAVAVVNQLIAEETPQEGES